MLTSTGLALLALLRRIGSFVHTLKSLILRCLILWPHVLRSLRRIRPLCSWTDPEDVPKKGGRTRTSPSFPVGASGVCEGYSTICASRDPNRSGEPQIRSGGPEVLLLAPIAEHSQSGGAPQSPATPASSFGHSSLDSPYQWHADRDFPGGSSSFIANAGDIQLPDIPHLNAPLTVTHSRITSAQFAGAPRRSRPPSPMSHSQALPPSTMVDSTEATLTPVHFPSPSPFPPHPLPQSSVLDSSGSARILDVAPISHDTSEGYPPPEIRIRVSSPSRSQTTNDDGQSNIESSRSPTHGVGHSILDPSHPGNLGSFQGNALQSSESPRPDTLSPYSNQARTVYPSQITLKLEDLPMINDSGHWSDGKTRYLGQMNSEQVSRYVSKGAV